MKELIPITEPQAKKLEELGVNVHVTYAVPKALLDVLNLLPKSKPKSPAPKAKRRGGEQASMYARRKAPRAPQKGSTREVAMKILDAKKIIMGADFTRKWLVTVLREALREDQVNWTITQMVKHKDIHVSRYVADD